MNKERLTLGFITNCEKRDNANVLSHLAETAKDADFLCAANEETKAASGFDFADINSVQPDFIISLGGDGSVLFASETAAERNVPLLGVNNGRVGFLTETEISDFPDALFRLKSGDYRTEARMMLDCTAGSVKRTSLNDFTVYKQSFAEVTHLTVYVDEINAGDVFCDGMVVSTPTGATAYSISAGGPVIAPRLDCILITPICPHSLCFRPIVANAHSVVRIKAHSPCVLACAGKAADNIEGESDILLTRSEKNCRFVLLREHNLYSLIRKKLT